MTTSRLRTGGALLGASRSFGDNGLVAVPVTGTAGTNTLEDVLGRARVLATLTLTTTTAVWVVARVHRHTTHLRPLTEPAGASGLAEVAEVVLLAEMC